MQKSLFDMDLKTISTGTEEFKDSAGERLDKLNWKSELTKTFSYNENEDRIKIMIVTYLKGIRKINKKGKFEFYLLRDNFCATIDDLFADEIKCKDIKELEDFFEGEKQHAIWMSKLPDDVLFDNHRYCWKFKEADGKVKFIEKWIGEINNFEIIH